MEKLTTDLEKEPDSIIIEETEAAEETGDPDEVELGFASAREANTDIKGKLHKVKAWFKKLPKPLWWRYAKEHVPSLVGVFFLAILVTAGFVFLKFLGGMEKYQEGFSAPFSLIEAAKFVKDDGDDLFDTLECYFWGSLHLAFVVYLAMYWVRRMGFFFGKKKKTVQSILAAFLRTLLAAAVFVSVLCFDPDMFDMMPDFWQGVQSCLTWEHLVYVPLSYLSRTPWMYLRWIAAFAIPALLLTNWSRVSVWKKKAPKIHPWFYTCCIALLVGGAGYAIVELSCESKLLMFLNLRFFAFIYWVLLFMFLHILTKRPVLSAWICLGLAEFIGLGNYIVMQFRGSYVMFGDLMVIGTALEVAGNYTLVMDQYFYIPLVIMVSAGALTWLLGQPFKLSKEEKKLKKQERLLEKSTKEGRKCRRKRVAVTFGKEAVLIAFVVIGMYNGFFYNYIKGNGWNYTQEVEEHGYLPYFFSNLMATQNVKLKGYRRDDADQAIEAGAKAYDAAHEKKAVQEPNIIVVQNEAFSDLSVLYDYELSEDCMPFIHSLTKNTQKGYVNTSVTGGPTANTEFEFLTRYSFAYLSTGSIAYAQYVKAKMPSLLTVLQNQETPYYTIGYHPYHAAGYNREGVYQTLGFDEGIFYEDTTGMKRIRNLLSDRGDYEDVISMYEKNKENGEQPLFVFNVTIQNHSPFLYLRDPLEHTVKVTSFAGTNGINNYFTLIRESDAAFEELVNYFSKQDEPTIILMYGDHQPSWDDDSKKVWDQHFIATDKAEQTRDKYYVPYIMWANYDIDEYDGLKWGDNQGEKNVISMNYLSSKLLEAAGVELSDYDKYLLNLHETIPAITSKGWWDAAGNWNDNNQVGEYEDERFKYHEICYNILFDKKHHLWERFQ